MIQGMLLLLVGMLSAVYLYFHYTYKYWIKKVIPQEAPTFIVGNLLDVVLNKKNLGWIYTEPYLFIPKQVSMFLENMMRQVIDNRLKNNIHRKDFFNHYLNLNKPLNDRITEIICHGTTFFIAGYETSSLPAGNLIYELSLNPHLQENLYQELETAYGRKTELDYGTIMTLPILDKASKETLRKYPIIYGLHKICTKQTTLKINGVDVEFDKGIPLFIPVYAMHHDPRHYPEPDVFDPERFGEEAVRARHPCTYLPFGAGPRTCAGINFGVLQMKLLVASIVYNYRIERTDRTPSKVSMKKSTFFSIPEEAQWIHLVKRK